MSDSKRKLKIHSSNIPQDKTDVIIKHINEGMDKFTIEKDIATHVKKKCDEVLSGTWHCVVGRNFGCSITHDTKLNINPSRKESSQSAVKLFLEVFST